MGLLLGVVPEAILVPRPGRPGWNQRHDQPKMMAQLDIRRQMFWLLRHRVETPVGSAEPSELATR
ncbi:hypothetical protein [Micromonospora chersina]|uniref:hypothetical protein n=1 Tax=Micromonospora chersina TaxID=47854 RepID=UPI00371ADC9B